jgi:tRNA(Arg) A34 adenosine deaminase TadA
MIKEEYLNEAFKLARQSMRNNIGGPFGAIVVKDDIIIGEGGNQVITHTDPTAHAEIVAIREACKNIANFDLSGAVIYATCEPCPMCLGAIYWSGIKEVVYGSTRYQAEAAGFRDSEIYKEVGLPPGERSITCNLIPHPEAEEIYKEWELKQDKLVY